MMWKFSILCLTGIFLKCDGNRRLLLGDNEAIEARFQKLEAKLRQEFETQLQLKISNMTAEINQLKQTVQNQDKHVGFYATLTPHTQLSQKVIVQFDRVLANMGNGFNKITGVFTVPISGLYHFSSTILQNGGTWLETEIMKNSDVIGTNYSNAHHATGTINVVISAQKGDTVYIRHKADGSVQQINGDGYSSFSGFCIA